MDEIRNMQLEKEARETNEFRKAQDQLLLSFVLKNIA